MTVAAETPKATKKRAAATVGRKIKLLRIMREMKQQDLAKAANVSVSHLCKIEAGRHYPHRPTLELIAAALGAEADWLERA
jgi:transcriptional regulator with XRE-family HTH domain